jgi:hypothetical protein
MYKILHTYFHKDGDPLVRHLMTYPYSQRLKECWYVDGASPVSIDVFVNNDRTYCEVYWTWESKIKYQKWINSTPDWDFLCEAGLANCKEQGVHQEHVIPEEEDVLFPKDDLVHVTLDQLIVEYKIKLNARVV